MRRLGSQRRQARSNLFGQVAMLNRAESQERTIVLNGNGNVSLFVGNNGEVVPCARVPRVDFDGVAEKLSRIGHPSCTLVDQSEVDHGLDVVGFCFSATRSSAAAASKSPSCNSATPRLLCAFACLGAIAIAFRNCPIACCVSPCS